MRLLFRYKDCFTSFAMTNESKIRHCEERSDVAILTHTTSKPIKKIAYRISHIAILIFFSLQLNGQITVPDFRSVSVDPVTNQVVLLWGSPNPAENILLHEVSRKPYASTDYFFTPVATVPMPDTVYRETMTGLESQRYGYRIRSKNNLDTSPISEMHITMQFSAEYDACRNVLNMRWTQYQKFYIDHNGQIASSQSVDDFNRDISYEVWGHHGSTFDIDSVRRLTNKSQQNTNVILQNLIMHTNYYLYVKAFLPTGDTATSHRITISTQNKKLPAVINIDSVISERGMVTLHLNLDRTTELDTIAVYRTDGGLKPISGFYKPTTLPASLTDQDAQIGQVYRYYIAGKLCGNNVTTSDTVSNIRMYATPNNLNTEIVWTEFFNPNTVTYNLIRLPGFNINPGSSLYYKDESTYDSVCRGPKTFCYVMEARTSKSYARSEQSCVSLNSVISMPEAIDPLSDIAVTKNCNCSNNCTNYRRLFGPVMDIDEDAYRMEMEIFDRSGVRIFQSKKDFNDYLHKETQYWDGTYKGHYVKPGVYVYFAKIEFKDSPPVTLRGSVTVVMRNL